MGGPPGPSGNGRGGARRANPPCALRRYGRIAHDRTRQVFGACRRGPCGGRARRRRVCARGGAGRLGRGNGLCLQHVFVPVQRRAGHVDGGGLLHARSRHGARQERGGHLRQEHRPLFRRRPDVLPHRLQPHVRRGRRRVHGQFGLVRLRRPGLRRRRQPCRAVGLVLPNGLRRHRRVDRFGDPRRAREASGRS